MKRKKDLNTEDMVVQSLTNHFSKTLNLPKKQVREEIEDSFNFEGNWGSWAEGYAGLFSVDGTSYYWVIDEETAEQIALNLVKDELESEPVLYITETDKRLIANEEADSYMENITDDEAIEKTDREDEYEDASDSEKERLISVARDELHNHHYEYVLKLLKHPISYFIDEQGLYSSIEELMKANFIGIDSKEAAKEAVRIAGWANFLSTYNGDYEVTREGVVFFRQ